MEVHFALLTFIALGIDFTSGLEAEDFVRTCWINGKRQLALHVDDESPNCLAFEAEMIDSNEVVKATTNVVKDQTVLSRLTTVVISSANNSRFWAQNLDKIYASKVASSILVILDITDNQQTLKELDSQLKPLDSYFYLVLVNETSFSWKQIITIQNNNQVVINNVWFDEQGYIIEEYDLQGIQVETVEINWAPFFTSEHCPGNLNCKPKGYLADALYILESLYNFKWISSRDPNNNWGTTPISGPGNTSGVWGGIVGSLIEKNYSISISAWQMSVARMSMFDFAPIIRANKILAIKSSPPDVDLDLFIRPLSRPAWIALGFVIVVILVFGLIVNKCIMVDQTSATDGQKLLKAVGWLTFVLIQVYYSGTLTMFFTADYTIPYDTIYDVFRDYPNVKLMHQKGAEFFFLYAVAAGDPDYKEYWDRVQTDPDHYKFKTEDEAMEEVLKGNIVFIDEYKVISYFKQHPELAGKITLFGRSHFSTKQLMFSYNSPLAPIFRQGFLRLSEIGIFDKLDHDWIGDLHTSSKSTTVLTVLSAGQVVLIFIITLIIFGAVLITLALEMLTQYWPLSFK